MRVHNQVDMAGRHGGLGRRPIWSAVAIGASAVTLMLAGPFCVTVMLGLLAIPVCLAAEGLLVAGLVARASKASGLTLVVVALGTTAATAALIAWGSRAGFVLVPLVIAAPALAGGPASWKPVALVTAGVVIAMVSLTVGMGAVASLALAGHRGTAAAPGWDLNLSMAVAAAGASFAATSLGLVRGRAPRAAVALAALVASVPGVACLNLVFLASLWSGFVLTA